MARLFAKDQFELLFFTTKQEGMGKGVCFAHAIIEAHGGKIRRRRSRPTEWNERTSAYGVLKHLSPSLHQLGGRSHEWKRHVSAKVKKGYQAHTVDDRPKLRRY
jgi:hypothetical protein